jgi:hypothetical protein
VIDELQAAFSVRNRRSCRAGGIKGSLLVFATVIQEGAAILDHL